MRLVDADAMRQDWLENGENEYVYDTNAVLDSIDAQPTIDAVHVVRCKDCKSCLKESAMTFTRNGEHIILYHCDDLGRLVRANDFCSYGERKDGEG